MGLLDKMFSQKKTIKNLSLGELQTEKIRLEEQERRVNKTIEKLEGDKGKLFKQGASEAEGVLKKEEGELEEY